MATLFVRHKVKDYNQWKKEYDAYDRKGDGCTRASVHRDTEDPNTVVVTEHFPSIDKAKAHVNSDKLKTAMGRAGVLGQPEFWYSEDVEEVKY
jgi:quinol monooxygenase YgiN